MCMVRLLCNCDSFTGTVNMCVYVILDRSIEGGNAVKISTNLETEF